MEKRTLESIEQEVLAANSGASKEEREYLRGCIREIVNFSVKANLPIPAEVIDKVKFSVLPERRRLALKADNRATRYRHLRVWLPVALVLGLLTFFLPVYPTFLHAIGFASAVLVVSVVLVVLAMPPTLESIEKSEQEAIRAAERAREASALKAVIDEHRFYDSEEYRRSAEERIYQIRKREMEDRKRDRDKGE